MRIQIGAVLISGVLIAGIAQAGESTRASKEEVAGVGSGALIGAAAGGPVGFIVGAALGGWLGDQFFRRTEDRDRYQAELEGTAGELASTSEQLRLTENELLLSEERRQTEQSRWTETLARTVNVAVLFKTGDAKVDAETAEQLAQLAELINAIGPVVVDVAGHADARGTEEVNEQLSAERAAVVRDILVRNGVSADRITTAALGETYAGGEDAGLDQHALDRRVEIRLEVGPTDRLARSD